MELYSMEMSIVIVPRITQMEQEWVDRDIL